MRFVGTHTRYPDLTGKRQAEGGKRLRGDTRENRPDAPLVTIITVCFNSAKTIEQTFHSVRNQTYGNVEYVVVDGGSSDGTVDLLKAHDDLIDYYVSEPDQGLYYAMNKGIELAQGELIVILNSDDWFCTDAVEALVEAKSYSGCDFTGALARYVDEKKGQSEVLRPMPFDDSVYFRMPLRHETMLIPAWLYNKVGPYDTDYRIIADRDYTARLFDVGATYYEVPRALLNFRTTGVSSTNISLLNTEKDMLLKKEFPFLSADEIAAMNDPRKADADTLARIANAHLDQPKFVKSVRALLEDRRSNGGKRWQGRALETIGADDPLSWPKVSVILPFYEAADTIARSIESALAQTLKDFEIVCINDCAIDDSQKIVDEFLARDKRIRCIKNPCNLGLGASRNAGIRAANGRYIFHLDPDDTIPEDALQALYATAVEHGSEMVKGAYKAGQMLHQEKPGSVAIKYPCGVRKNVVPNTSLNRTPRLLFTTEGHWSYLYDATFIRRVPYPTDLKMGQDSIFLVNAVARAKKVTLLPQVIYHYEANANSAMNQFTTRKYFDGLEWRRRAWYVLRDAKRTRSGDRLLFSFWSEAFFRGLEATLTDADLQRFNHKLARIFRAARYPGAMPPEDPALSNRFAAALAALPNGELVMPDANAGTGLRIATFSTRDHGGAGNGSQRRVDALRRFAVEADIHSLFKKTDKAHVYQTPFKLDPDTKDLQKLWRKKAVLTRQEHPLLKAREMFSKPGSVVNFKDMKQVFENADIVHMHWVSGMFDYENTTLLADKPVVWTLADMNAFTGGCHYSEGCRGYENDCRNCPLLAPGSDLAHKAWKKKREAYAKIKNLHVICPSQWLADCARNSSLFGDRPVHVIPNALPVDRFNPTNRLIARRKLGLPLDKKLVAFGADSLQNRRKGGDILVKAVKVLKDLGLSDGIEGLFFGANTLELGIPAHAMGHVSEEEKMSLVYAAADVFAFPSREDNAPLTVAEAMLSGTPVVGFPVGNVPELLEHKINGYIARYEDAKDLADGLAWALGNPDGHSALERRMRAHMVIRRHNDPATAAARHIAIYRQILCRSASNSDTLLESAPLMWTD